MDRAKRWEDRVMRRHVQVLIAATCILCPGMARGQVVQLPTFRSFSVNTTVTVPDRGSAVLGGVDRVSTGRVSRSTPMFGHIPGTGRMFHNRGLGSSFSTSRASVSATIIDHEQLDRAVLAQAAARRDPARGMAAAMERRAVFLSRHVARASVEDDARKRLANIPADALPLSVAEIQRRNQNADDQQRHEAVAHYNAGIDAANLGKTSLARSYFRLAVRNADGALRQEVLGQLNKLRK